MSGITPRDLSYAIAISLVLLGFILLCLGIYHFLIRPILQRGKITKRLSEGTRDYLVKLQILKARGDEKAGWQEIIFKALLGSQRFANLQRDLLQADIYYDPGKFLMFSVGLGAAGFFVINWLLRSSVLGLIVGVTLGVLPFTYAKWKKHKKTLAFEAQMPDAMELLARSLRAGHTLPSAIELLGDEMDDPMATEMRITFEEQRFGISMSEAMVHMLERVDSQDLRYFVSALLIQQDTGGNLAELMEKIAYVIRGRLNFKVKVRALTAMGRMSAYIMTIVPILTFFGLMVIARHYVSVLLTTDTGRKLLIVGIILLTIGFLSLRKLIKNVEAG
ncbi:MAG: type II secretion system F family protein [Deltaproteobacteria bacterium]|nr:type II secretion system F family protein [Desulfitobacteriaceae bacterium]MDI6855087.1 type II secretion system F family protein [Deltaproteobacteria bacterium]